MSRELHAELHDLVARLCTDRLSADDALRLQELVMNDAEARATYVQLMDMQGRLVWGLRGANTAVTPTVGTVLLSGLGGKATSTQRPVLLSILLVACVFYGSFALIAWNLRTWSGQGGEIAAPHVAQTNPATSHSIERKPVAKLTRTTDCRWQPSADVDELVNGQLLRPGDSLPLTQGTAEVEFNSGAKVLLQGPATFEVLTAGAGELEIGQLVATVPKQAVGFTIETSHATLIDRGTQFGVTAREGGDVDVQVFVGAVDVKMREAADTRVVTAPQPPTRMVAGNAKRFSKTSDGDRLMVSQITSPSISAEAREWIAGGGAAKPDETRYAAAVLADKPLAYFRLSDRGNRIAADASGHEVLAEYSGIVGSMDRGICPSTSDRCVRFIGKGGDGKLLIPEIAIPESFSVECWAQSKAANWNTSSWLVTSRRPSGFILHPEENGRSWRFILVVNAPSEFVSFGTHTPARIDDRLHHYVGTYDAATDEGAMFFDGREVARLPKALGSQRKRETKTLPVSIGRDDTGSHRLGEGWIDELAIYPHALTAERVAEHYRAAQPIDPSASTTDER